jgi:uncharacterized membrane protein YdbT with pleckstrin-like domain
MAYIDSILGHGEEKLYVAHRHVIFLIARTVVRILIALVLIVLGIVLKVKVHDKGHGMAANILLLICIAAALVPIVQTIILGLKWRNEMYVVTPRRVIQIEGVLGKHTMDSSLNMINDLILDQSIWGRMLNFGDLQVVTGNDLGDRLQGVADPFAFKRALLAAREQYAQPLNTTPNAAYYTEPLPTAPPPEDVPTLIARLADLRDRGAISEAEFDTKRAELLRRI